MGFLCVLPPWNFFILKGIIERVQQDSLLAASFFLSGTLLLLKFHKFCLKIFLRVLFWGVRGGKKIGDTVWLGTFRLQQFSDLVTWEKSDSEDYQKEDFGFI